MNKIGAYKVFVDKRLIIEYYSGCINLNDLISLKEVIRQESNYNFSFNTVIDFRDATVNLDKADLIKLLDYFSNEFKANGFRNVAYLGSTTSFAKTIALFSDLAESKIELNIYPNVFSMAKRASNWLNDEFIDGKLLNDTLNELRLYPNNVYKTNSIH